MSSKINSIHLRNFKRHEALDVEFADGVNLITGPNYSGKTTVLSAIMFALGGASHVPGPNIQRRGTNTGLLVEMDFTLAGEPYTVVRKRNTASLLHKGIPIAHGISPVNEKIEELLGESLKRFRQLRYAEQKQAHALLSYSAGELLKIIEELTHASDITAVLDTLGNRVNALTYVLEQTTDAPSAQELEELSISAAAAGQAHQAASEALSVAEIVWQKAASRRDAAQEELMPLEGAEKRHAQLLRKQAELVGEQATLRREYERREQEAASTAEPPSEEALADVESRVTAGQAAQRRFLRIHGEWKMKQAEISLLERQLLQAKASQSDAERRLGEVSEGFDLSFLEGERAKVADFLEKERAAEAEAREARQSLSSARCGACNRPFDMQYDVRILEKRIKDAETAAVQWEGHRIAAEREVAALARTERAIEQMQSALASSANRVLQLNQQLQDARIAVPADEPAEDFQWLEALETELTSGRALRQAFVRAEAPLLRLKRDLSEVDAALAEVDNELSGMLFSPEALQDARDFVKETQREFEAAHSALAAANLARATAHSERQALEVRLKGAKALYDSRAEQERKLGVAVALQKFLKAGRARYTGQIWASFMASASAFVRACTDGAIEELKRTEDGRFVFVEDGHEMHLKDASGAQAAIMGLGLQIALSDAAACPLDVLLVDEPCADMDPDHSLAATAMLASLGRQVIAISHAQMDSSVCSHAIVLGG